MTTPKQDTAPINSNSVIFEEDPFKAAAIPEDGQFVTESNELTKDELSSVNEIILDFLRQQLPCMQQNFSVWQWTSMELVGISFGILADFHTSIILDISYSKLLGFILEVGRGYNHHPYHSMLHAIDVLQYTYYLLIDHGVAQFLQPIDCVCMLISALCHDIGHPGYNNLFQVHAKTELADLYKTSILERYSIALTFELFEKHELLAGLSPSDVATIKANIEEMILNTDMAFHFALLDKLVKFSESVSKTGMDIDLSPEHKGTLMSVVVHGADISNACRPWVISKQWGSLIVEEFFRQGDEEKQRNFPISPNMDRLSSDPNQIGLSFNDFIVRPFFFILSELFPSMSVIVDELNINRGRWDSVVEETESQLDLNTQRPRQRVASERPISRAELLTEQEKAITNSRKLSIAAGTVTIPHDFIAMLQSRSSALTPLINRASRNSSIRSSMASGSNSNSSTHSLQGVAGSLSHIGGSKNIHTLSHALKQEPSFSPQVRRTARHSVSGVDEIRRLNVNEKKHIWERFNDITGKTTPVSQNSVLKNSNVATKQQLQENLSSRNLRNKVQQSDIPETEEEQQEREVVHAKLKNEKEKEQAQCSDDLKFDSSEIETGEYFSLEVPASKTTRISSSEPLLDRD